MTRTAARHILVFSEAKYGELKTAIEGGTDFTEVAREHSTCPSDHNGGSLDSFDLGQMVRESDQVVFSTPLNVIQDPVKTQFSYHLLEITSRQGRTCGGV